MSISVKNKWDPLREVVLGRSYSADFYSNIKNPKIRSCLSRIADETEEDYSRFEQLLRSHGVIVHRPCLDPADRIENYTDDNHRIQSSMISQNGEMLNISSAPEKFVSNTLIPKPPMNPRDAWAVIQDDLVMTSFDHPALQQVMHDIAERNSTKIIDSWQTFNAEWSGGMVYIIEQDAYIGDERFDQHSKMLLQSRYPDINWHFLPIEGHGDGVYHLLKPGVMMSLRSEIHLYKDLFPSWDVLLLPDQSWHAITDFLRLKSRNQGKWWLPGEEHNDEFTYFVEQWLANWVGYVEETVFDVNCLMLDDRHIFVNNYNREVFNFLKRHAIEPVIVPFRHRYFWDGGLHCITQEIERG